MAIWFTNTWNTKYLPINSNASFNNKGGSFKVLKVLDENGDFSEALYQKYSQPWFSAGWVVYNFWAFASYTASFTYVLIFHWHDVSRGFRGIWRNLRRRDFEDEDDLEEDVHYRLMRAYKEVPEWHYLVLLVLPIALGVAAVVAWPTHASPAALFYGILIPLVFIIPIGIIQAVTGIPVALNILAAILGGVINSGNPNGLIFFKCWAYLSSWQALGSATISTCTLSQDPAPRDVLRSDRRHIHLLHGIRPQLQLHPRSAKCLHRRRSLPLHMPVPDILLHHDHLLGRPQPKATLWARSAIQYDAPRLPPRRRPRPR